MTEMPEVGNARALTACKTQKQSHGHAHTAVSAQGTGFTQWFHDGGNATVAVRVLIVLASQYVSARILNLLPHFLHRPTGVY